MHALRATRANAHDDRRIPVGTPAAGRHPQDIELQAIQTALDAVSLIDLARGDLLAAGTQTPLRSGDAILLAVALRVGADEIVTYDG